jgi:hypothetical protein
MTSASLSPPAGMFLPAALPYGRSAFGQNPPLSPKGHPLATSATSDSVTASGQAPRLLTSRIGGSEFSSARRAETLGRDLTRRVPERREIGAAAAIGRLTTGLRLNASIRVRREGLDR